MKTFAAPPHEGTAAIVHLASRPETAALEGVPVPDAADMEQKGDPVARARAFAEPLLAGQRLDTGEGALEHADGVAAVLRAIGAGAALRAAAYLVYAGDYLQRPEEVVHKAFGASYASLVTLTRKLVQIQRAARAAQVTEGRQALQTERVRKMLLAFSRDLRVVLLRLASRLQTLRWFAAARVPCPQELATESLEVFAPLANRLGIWQIKWELEDLSFRFLQPQAYQEVARLVDQTRMAREVGVHQVRQQLADRLQVAGLQAEVEGRPKHLYGIWKKMQGKSLAFARIFDNRALRVIAADVAACYAVLACVHEAWRPVEGEFDDYIAKPKPNGYQSLHTVVLDGDNRALEVQIRTRAMHEHAEHGVAAHWMYKEAGYTPRASQAPAPQGTAGEVGKRMADARKAVLRELLAWERDFSTRRTDDEPAAFDDRVYVFTPQAAIVDLPAGGTPIDFAYSLHTDLGHRCRGARVDGVMVPLNTPLQSGQTVEVVAAKEGGPSLDWLNPELHHLASPRARAKVRAWFNGEHQAQTIARGRDAVEKLLQREGRTALERGALAEQLGFKSAEALFEVVGKDELSLRTIENLLRPAEPASPEQPPILRRPRADAGNARGGVLVVGMDSLLTTLARCCRPAPPDSISGFVTRGRGVAVHRASCPNLRHLSQDAPGRVIDVAWGADPAAGGKPPVYPLDVSIEATDRAGLLRDISEVFVKEGMNVTGVQSQSAKDRRTASMTFTVEVADAARLQPVLVQISRVAGVSRVRRR
jgi:GTP pyrophosphokinase